MVVCSSIFVRKEKRYMIILERPSWWNRQSEMSPGRKVNNVFCKKAVRASNRRLEPLLCNSQKNYQDEEDTYLGPKQHKTSMAFSIMVPST